MLTRRWPAAVLAAVFCAAIWGLLLAGPVMAEDPPVGPGDGQIEAPIVDPVPVVDPIDPGVEVPADPATDVPAPDPAPVYVEPAPVYMEPAPVYVEPAPAIEAPVEEVIPEAVPEVVPVPEPAPEVTEAPAPSPTTAVPVVKTDLTKTAGTAGVPEGSPFYVQAITFVLLVLLGIGYFKRMSQSGRRTQTSNSAANAKRRRR